MPEQRTLKATLDDALLSLVIPDFSGGLNSELDPLDLALNASPDCENVKFESGSVVGRDGYVVRINGLPANRDGTAFFYDNSGTRRLVAFASGNLYDCSTGTANLVDTGVYTAGLRVATTLLNSVLYFSDGETIHSSGGNDSGVRYYDPPTSMAAAPLLVSAGGTGVIPTPACKVLKTVAGQLVLADIKYTNGQRAADSLIWSNVNDPTTILGTNIFRVGAGQGGSINSIQPFSVASVGIAPFDGLFVGKSLSGCYLLSGALTVNTLKETVLNTRVGVKDGATVDFIPVSDTAGYVLFLGTDYQVYRTNGIDTDILSKPIKRQLRQYIADRVGDQPGAQFASVKIDSDFLYVLDCGGGRQYCYSWEEKNWTRYRGWPSGHWVTGRDSAGQEAIYCLDTTNAHLAQVNVGFTDNGAAINPYWTSAALHAGSPETLKIWKWLYCTFRTNRGIVNYTATAKLRSGDSASGSFVPDAANDASLIWDLGNWDEGLWASSGAASYASFKRKDRLAVLVDETTMLYDSLRGEDVQIRLSQANEGRFQIDSLTLRYLPRGHKRVA